MKVLITGARGQLGRALMNIKPFDTEIFAMDRTNFDMLDIDVCLAKIRSIKPDWVINCGAYTNVELAESQKEIAMKVNYETPARLAEEIEKQSGCFLQISSDYVFGGDSKKQTPYEINHPRSPLGVYALSKAKGEEAIENIFHGTQRGLILRTSWLIGPVGKNFLLTILNLHKKKKEIRIVYDQIGCLTSTFTLAEFCWKILDLNDISMIFDYSKNGILHWQDKGETNWFEIALEISRYGREIGLIKNKNQIKPIESEKYPSKVRRPKYSVLDCEFSHKFFQTNCKHWTKSVKEILDTLNYSNEYLKNLI